jgi:hypothetical protein
MGRRADQTAGSLPSFDIRLELLVGMQALLTDSKVQSLQLPLKYCEICFAKEFRHKIQPAISFVLSWQFRPESQ